MSRSVAFSLAVIVTGILGGSSYADTLSSGPRRYELLINGESFFVELDRQTPLVSKEKPGIAYDVALRIAVQQPLELNTLQLEYDWPALVEDDRSREQRTVRIRQKFGYTVLLTELGGPLAEKAQSDALKILTQSVTRGLNESGINGIESSRPYVSEFSGARARGVTIRYQDKEGFGQTYLVYLLLVGEKSTASCVVQYFDKDRETVLPRIKALLNSVRPLR